MINLILCGGNGTRLWPISRTLMPKQFVKLFSDKSLFQLTVERNAKLCDSQFIVSNTEQYFLALDQLEELDIANSCYLLEPVGRNTAPAIALACLAMDADEIVLVTPSDHLIKNETTYQNVVARAQQLALEDNLVTFGIKPTFAETGFGYIESVSGTENVKAFHEKPDLDTATAYLASGNYYWNSGMFMFKAGVFLRELKTYSPDIYNACVKAHESAKQEGALVRINHDAMQVIPEDSIDYAVMEKSQCVKVVPADIDWNDIGSFDALYDELPKDEQGNTQNPDHIALDSSNNLVFGNERKIATVDVNDSIIVDTGDALLISKRGSSQKVKDVVQQLKKEAGSQLHNKHLTTHRPWGTYTLLQQDVGYKVKRIEVKPGKSLSLQKHHHRSEHWIVLVGTATVTVGEETKLIHPNESISIPIGQAHRLSNEGNTPVIMIEAQVGEYVEEDDTLTLGQTPKNIFRECDIRGIYPHELNEQTVKKLGYFFALKVKEKVKEAEYIAVGYDARLHSPQISRWLTSGISYAGLGVLDLGMVPTPLSYFSNFVKVDAKTVSASIMVTGSHNPSQYNGFKFTLDKAPFFADDIYTLGDKIIASDINIPNITSSIEVDIKKQYVNYMKQQFAHLDLQGKSFVFDCGNGVVDTVLSDVLTALNIKHKLLFAEPDGSFPNHHPDPSDIKNLQDLKQELVTGKYDLGFAYDGDADRIAVLSEKYNFKGDVLAIFFARFIENPTVIGEVKCSQVMYDMINNRGKAIMYKTGHSHLKQKIKEIDASFATEVSGHLYFNDRYFGFDDAIYVTLRTLELISNGFDLDKEYEILPQIFTTEEIQIATTEDKKFSIVSDIETVLKNPPQDFPAIREILTVDGLRIVFDKGWGLVRASNTTPNLITRFEATDKEELINYQSQLTNLIKQYI